MVAIKNKVKSIVIPVFGGATGRVKDELAAKMLWLGYYQIMHPNKTINWSIAGGFDDFWMETCLKEI